MRSRSGPRYPVAGKAAVVTGAASGIGRALAVELARRGARLAVSDVDLPGLAATVGLVQQAGAEVHSARVDVRDRLAVAAYADEVAAHFGQVHQVYNNAGIALSRSLLDSDWEDYDRVLGVNLYGVLHGTKAFLPHLVASGDGHVVNVSSLNGYVAQALMSHYCTSKFAVRGFTESLRAEVASQGLPVRVTVVHPGGVRTAIARSAREQARERGRLTDEEEARSRLYEQRLLRMDPAQAARIVVDGVEQGRPRILVGKDAALADLLVRLLPVGYQGVIAALQRRVVP